eukprot:m.188197 g.188197  ORF g.188197 m.188197 type:complete len:194 (+) comp53594_c1_seq19:1650-2231(+)
MTQQLSRMESELQTANRTLARQQQSLQREQDEHQATRIQLQASNVAYANECTAHQATRSTLAVVNQEFMQFRAAVAAQLQQDAQVVAGMGSRLALDDVCVLIRFWKLDIKLDALRASSLAPLDIPRISSVTLKKKLSCNYGTALALISSLRTLADSSALASPRTGCTDLLDTALQRARPLHCIQAPVCGSRRC